MDSTTKVIADCAGRTDPGSVRPTNQDQFLIAELWQSALVQDASVDPAGRGPFSKPGALFLAVADGLGGHAGGDVASDLAIRTAVEGVLDVEDDARRGLAGLFQRSQDAIRAGGEREPEYREMATTLTIALVAPPTLYVAHAGDSRVYQLRGGRLRQLTSDHALGKRLWNVVGGLSPDLDPEIHASRVDFEDVLLLCTDGLTRHVDDLEIREVLRTNTSAEEKCRSLVDLALERGGIDNVTAVVAQRIAYPREG